MTPAQTRHVCDCGYVAGSVVCSAWHEEQGRVGGVAAVLAGAKLATVIYDAEDGNRSIRVRNNEEAAAEALAVLTAAGYAVVAVPEGVAVAHGARLVPSVLPAHPVLYRIHEATP